MSENPMPVEDTEATPAAAVEGDEAETATPADDAEMPVDGAEDGDKPAEA